MKHKIGMNDRVPPTTAMEDAYRLLIQMERNGDPIDEVVKAAMNAALIVMEAVEQGHIDPARHIYFNGFLSFKANKDECLCWIQTKFQVWLEKGYPAGFPFLALKALISATDSRRFAVQKNAVNGILEEIAQQMKIRATNNLQKRNHQRLAAESIAAASGALYQRERIIFSLTQNKSMLENNLPDTAILMDARSAFE